MSLATANVLGNATIYSRNAISKSNYVKTSKSQTVESFSMNPSGTYAGGSLAASAGRHYITASKSITMTLKGTADRTNDWLLKDSSSSNKMSLTWDPTDDYTYTCVGHTNTIHGTITIKGGTFEVGDSCSFPNVTSISISSGATLKMSSQVDVPFQAITAAASGSTLHLDSDMSVLSVKVNKTYLKAKEYTAGSYSGLTITGTGRLYVSTDSNSGNTTYTWTGEGEDSNISTTGNWLNGAKPDFATETPYIIFAGGSTAVLDCNVEAYGIAFGSGVTGFDLSASGDHYIAIGKGGITNNPAASARAPSRFPRPSCRRRPRSGRWSRTRPSLFPGG